MIDNALYNGERYFEGSKLAPDIKSIKNAFLNNQRVIMGFTTNSGGGHAVMVNKIKIWSSGKYKVYFAETSPGTLAFPTRDLGTSYRGARFWSFNPLPKPVPIFKQFRKI